MGTLESTVVDRHAIATLEGEVRTSPVVRVNLRKGEGDDVAAVAAPLR